MKAIFRKFICAALSALILLSLASCSKMGYKEYHEGKHLAANATVGGTDLCAYLFIPEEERDAVLDLCGSDGKVLWRMELPADGNEYYTSLDFDFAFDGAVFQDMNFDGEADLYVPLSVTTPNLEGMAWLWDKESEEFLLSDELSKLYELTVYADDELIASQEYKENGDILCKEFKWENGSLVQVGEYTIVK